MTLDIWALIGGLAIIISLVAGIVQILDYLQKRQERNRQPCAEDVVAPSPAAPAVPGNLPSRGGFIGRGKEEARVGKALASRGPLTRIDGIGGTGRTAPGLTIPTAGQEPAGCCDNPFYHRDAIKDQDYFWGRERETRRILTAVKREQCVSVVGPRHIGKTSLLFHVADKQVLAAHGLAPGKFVMVYCTGQGLRSDSQSDLQGYLLEKIRSRLSLDIAYHRLDEIAGYLTWKGLTIVLLLDEFELFAVNSNSGESFFHNLRALQSQYALRLVASSQTSLRELSCLDESSLPRNFFQMFRRLDLGLFSSKEAASLITGLSQRAGITFSERTIEFILDVAGLHPFFLQVAGDYVFERRSTQAQLDASDYESLRQEISSELEGHFRYYWDTLDRAQQSVLVNLEAAQASPDHAHCLEELVRQGLGVKKGQVYDYVSTSFEKFVRKHQAALLITQGNESLIGRELGSVRIVEKIGSGGMATVYKGYQPLLDRYVAVKVLSRNVQREGFLPRFRREAQAVARLHHPNILSIYDFGQEEDLAYIVMACVSSGTLADLIHDGLPLARAIEIAIRVGDALHCAHQQGIVHRDVEPTNILMDTDGRPLLTDFGLVKFLKSSEQLTKPGIGVGTAAYMAPEQASGKDVDARSDVYALGLVLYEMVTGCLPFEAEDSITMVLKKLQELPPPPSQFNPSLPIEVEQVIMKAIAPLPEGRYQSASEMSKALNALRPVIS